MTDTTPWYRQFWPWFLIGLPLTSVIAGITTVFIAFNNADSLVNDNYYKDGLAINQTLAQDQVANELGLQAALKIDRVTGELLVDLSGNLSPPQTLNLLLMHPVDAARDNSIALKHIANGRYRADLAQAIEQRYYVRLQPDNQQWRLNGEWDFARREHTTLMHNE